jgi:large subunit ribosomal protein L29
MRAHELRELNADELQAKQVELREQLFKLRFQKAIGQLDNENKLGQTRREIARVLTVLKEKQA